MVVLDNKGLKGSLVLKALLEHRVQLELMVQPVHKDNKAQRVSKVLRVPKERMVPLDNKAHKALMVPLANKELKGLLD